MVRVSVLKPRIQTREDRGYSRGLREGKAEGESKSFPIVGVGDARQGDPQFPLYRRREDAQRRVVKVSWVSRPAVEAEAKGTVSEKSWWGQ